MTDSSADHADQPRPVPDTEEALTLLAGGALTVRGRLVNASNATLYCEVCLGGTGGHCVYKPIRGERPLWDFPDGTLAGREVAAYRVSAATGWNVVPPTVLRDGPFGTGMAQLWIDGDDTVDLVRLARADDPALRRMAVLDAVLNNADRKGGHLIPMPDGHVYGVDHGVCFAVDPKLRTVLWGWAGQPLTDDAVDTLSDLRARLAGALGDELRELLTAEEVVATEARVDELLSTGRHPEPGDDWRSVPWPPF